AIVRGNDRLGSGNRRAGRREMTGHDLLTHWDASAPNATRRRAPKLWEPKNPNQTGGHFVEADASKPAERHPLRTDQGGAARVGKSRISLDLVVEQYENGMTPEDMVRAYDTLVLADVYAVLAHYLRHRDEVRAYLKRRTEEAESLRAKIEAERPRV